jgi:type I restriction enzyme, S subunit
MTRPNLNAVALVSPEFDGEIASTGFDVRRALGVDPRWAYYLVRSENFVRAMSDLVQGALYPAVRSKDVGGFHMPLAPLNEQRRIADKLDSLFAKVDACRKCLDRVPDILKRLRQAVLAAACSGKLTEEWREKWLSSSTWEHVTLADVIADKPKNGHSARPVDHVTPFRVLTLSATTSGRFDPRHFKYFAGPVPQDSPLWLQPDDILVQRGNTREYVGMPALYDGPPGGFTYPDLMMKLRANNRVSSKFLYYALSCERSRQFLQDRATGTAGNMPKINQATLLGVPIELPSRQEQSEITRRVDAVLHAAETAMSSWKVAEEQVGNLAAKILAKAFRGELVPQDSKDEPAEFLLRRIKALKAEAVGERSNKRRVERTSAMSKLNKDSLKEAIHALPSKSFSFEDLRRQVPADYDTLKDLLFELLDEPEPLVRQIFDKQSQSIRLERLLG